MTDPQFRRVLTVTLTVAVHAPDDRPLVNEVEMALREAMNSIHSTPLGVTFGVDTFSNGERRVTSQGALVTVEYENEYYEGSARVRDEDDRDPVPLEGDPPYADYITNGNEPYPALHDDPEGDGMSHAPG